MKLEGIKKEEEKLDNICEECKKEDESVSQNLMMHGYKICDSCKISKTIFQFNPFETRGGINEKMVP